MKNSLYLLILSVFSSQITCSLLKKVPDLRFGKYLTKLMLSGEIKRNEGRAKKKYELGKRYQGEKSFLDVYKAIGKKRESIDNFEPIYFDLLEHEQVENVDIDNFAEERLVSVEEVETVQSVISYVDYASDMIFSQMSGEVDYSLFTFDSLKEHYAFKQYHVDSNSKQWEKRLNIIGFMMDFGYSNKEILSAIDSINPYKSFQGHDEDYFYQCYEIFLRFYSHMAERLLKKAKEERSSCLGMKMFRLLYGRYGLLERAKKHEKDLEVVKAAPGEHGDIKTCLQDNIRYLKERFDRMEKAHLKIEDVVIRDDWFKKID